jgi:hypothetical protein
MQTLQCPHCHKTVMVPWPESRWERARRRRRAIWLTVSVLLILALASLGYYYRAHVLAGLDLIGEATGGRTTAALSVAGAVLVLAIVLAWVLFPIIVLFGFRELRRHTAELDETTRSCVTQLAQLATDRGPGHAPKESASNPPPG